MGEKYLGQLTAKSAPATGDILVLEDSEDTKKIDYDALANAILNKLTTKTYTVAGGTNTLIAAIDALNSKLNPIANKNGNWLVDVDADTYTTTGIYPVRSGTNLPGTWLVLVVIATRDDTVIQYAYDDTRKYYRQFRDSWSTWEVQPSRDEVNALKNVLSPSLSGCGSNSAIHAVQIGTVVAVTAKIEYSGTSNMAISGLPNHNGDTQNGFVVTARDQTDGSIARMWTNGGKNIMKYDNLTDGHMYGLSYTYITA